MARQTIDIKAAVLITLHWTDFKALVVAKSLYMQYVNGGGIYTIFAVEGQTVFQCTLIPAANSDTYDFPNTYPDYTKQQNDADCADFEQNFKTAANAPAEPRAKDGRPVVRDSCANRTTNFKLRAFSFYTSNKASRLHNVNPVTEADYGDVTITLYDAQDTVITDETSAVAVKTVIDWEPHYNYEVIGGFMDTPAGLAGGTTDQWYISAIGVPDYPPAYFGQIDYIAEVNLEAVTAQRVISDGRAVSYLPYRYNNMPGTNKLRFIVKHPPGAQQRFQVFIEHFQ
jgi:hypothetical protein